LSKCVWRPYGRRNELRTPPANDVPDKSSIWLALSYHSGKLNDRHVYSKMVICWSIFDLVGCGGGPQSFIWRECWSKHWHAWKV